MLLLLCIPLTFFYLVGPKTRIQIKRSRSLGRRLRPAPSEVPWFSAHTHTKTRFQFSVFLLICYRFLYFYFPSLFFSSSTGKKLKEKQKQLWPFAGRCNLSGRPDETLPRSGQIYRTSLFQCLLVVPVPILATAMGVVDFSLLPKRTCRIVPTVVRWAPYAPFRQHEKQPGSLSLLNVVLSLFAITLFVSAFWLLDPSASGVERPRPANFSPLSSTTNYGLGAAINR